MLPPTKVGGFQAFQHKNFFYSLTLLTGKVRMETTNKPVEIMILIHVLNGILEIIAKMGVLIVNVQVALMNAHLQYALELLPIEIADIMILIHV